MTDIINLNPSELPSKYEYVDDNEDVKAKIWQGDNGKRRVYIRVRRHDDRRKFDDLVVHIDEESDNDSQLDSLGTESDPE